MVLESLTGAEYAEKRPAEMFIVAFAYTTIAILLSLWVFAEYAGLTMVFFTVMAAIPLMIKLIVLEERKLFTRAHETTHRATIPFFIFLFLGMVSAYTFFFTVLPEATVNQIFNVQISTIQSVNTNIMNQLSGQFFGEFFPLVIFNNLKVMTFAVLFSFIYGSGAIFILTWNASVLGVAIGSLIREIVGATAASVGAVGVGTYFGAVSISFARYLIHGIPEIGAYFVAGLAGGIISVGVLRYQLFDERFMVVMKDALFLLIVAVILVLVSGAMEVLISPLFYA
ncbi:MAG: stage II sporulation protein M [Candidatus Nanoarchaeia archaeon]|jgi:uncharacterized membrane protein SpoIIM required for sporulation|nr:stage II sporulation protein M [Candidatus Nanoarchaeia archaeon]|tara:strand:+ start:14736 stop:15584 length:849 start_codon:yes stop_codon:yes gene_type:complete